MSESSRSTPLSHLLLAALLSPLLLALPTPSAAQPGAVVAVGPMVATVPDGWEVIDTARIEWLLAQQLIQNSREFALAGPGRALIYAVHGEWGDFSITAQAINAMPLPRELESQWGLNPADISSRVQPLPVGLDAVVLIAGGPGSGQDFETAKDVPTVAAQVDVPVIYRVDGGPARSGVSTLFFRAPQDVASGGELTKFREMITSLRLQEGHTLATAAELVPTPDEVPEPEVVAAAPAVAPPAASSSLSAWVDALSALDAEAELPAAERAAKLQPVASALPANPFLAEKLSDLQAAVSESTWVGQFLSDDPNGTKAGSLRGLHQAILARVRRESGIAGVGSYLRYLSRVWPDNRLAEPPGQGVSQGARWTNPYLGLEMVRIEPIEGRPFWISTKPLLEFLRGQRLVDVPLPESPTRQQAVDLAASVSASLPTQAEYRAWVGALNPRFDSRRRYWAERSESGGRDPAVEIGTSVTSLSKRSGYRLKDGDFYLVVR